MKKGSFVVVTVATTEFDQLIEAVDSELFLQAMSRFGFAKLLVQRGRGTFEPNLLSQRDHVLAKYGIEVEIIRFHDQFADVIRSCDLLIGHCGAGTILDAVVGQTKMIVVVNDTLQGNHQMELARVIQEKDFCKVTSLPDLYACLDRCYEENFVGKTQHTTFPILEPDRFAYVLDSLFEFA